MFTKNRRDKENLQKEEKKEVKKNNPSNTKKSVSKPFDEKRNGIAIEKSKKISLGKSKGLTSAQGGAVKEEKYNVEKNIETKINGKIQTVDKVSSNNKNIFIIKDKDSIKRAIEENTYEKKFCDIGIALELFTKEQANKSLSEQEHLSNQGQSHIYIGEVLKKNGFLNDDKTMNIVSHQSGYKFFKVSDENPNIKKFAKEFSQKTRAESFAKLILNNRMAILGMNDNAIIVGVVNDKQFRQITKGLGSFFPHHDIFVYLLTPSSLEVMQKRNIINIFFTIDFNVKYNEYEKNNAHETMFMDMVTYAFFTKTSDIHIEQDDVVVKIYMRTGGDREWLGSVSRDFGEMLINKIFMLAQMKPDGKSYPQDGAIVFSNTSFNIKGLNLRISNIPIVSRNGNRNTSTVIRLLSAGTSNINLRELNVDLEMTDAIESVLEREAGMVLVVGPTGSGKSTLLNGTMGSIDKISRSVITIENPVENLVSGWKQIEIDDKSNVEGKKENEILNFETSLRAILRHDPNVIMVGEIRDKETMKIAIHAVDTSHLVLGTLHAINVNKTVSRLINMAEGEISRESILESILAIISQRLVKKVCPRCSKKIDYEFSENEIKVFPEVLQRYFKKNGNTLNIPKVNKTGCEFCKNGYQGVLPVNEYMIFNDKSRQDFLDNNYLDLEKLGYDVLEITLLKMMLSGKIDIIEFRRYLN